MCTGSLFESRSPAIFFRLFSGSWIRAVFFFGSLAKKKFIITYVNTVGEQKKGVSVRFKAPNAHSVDSLSCST